MAERDKPDESPSDENLHVSGPMGTGMDLPKSMLAGITPAIAHWVIPALGVGLLILAMCWGAALIIKAMNYGQHA